VGDFVRYKILYLPLGQRIKNALVTDKKEFDHICDTELEAEKLIWSMIRKDPPQFFGFMAYNEIIFPSIRAHFEIIEVIDENH
jgi:hypothetical protein